MVDKSPLISICLATYNGEKYLIPQLDSLVNQSYPNLEIVISDDNSTDNTVDILKDYQQKSIIPFKIFKNSHQQGFVANFANALSYCQGKYIALCDQDDIWYFDKIQRLYNFLQQQKALLVYSNARIIDSENNVINDSWFYGYNKTIYPLSGQVPEVFYLYNSVTGCMALLDAKLLQWVSINAQVYYHDWFLAWAAARYGKVMYLDEKLMDYRRHNQSVTYRKNKKIWLFNSLNFSKFYQENNESFRHNKGLLKQLGYIKSIEESLKVDTTLLKTCQNYLLALQNNFSAQKQTEKLLEYPILISARYFQEENKKFKKLSLTRNCKFYKKITNGIMRIIIYIFIVFLIYSFLYKML